MFGFAAFLNNCLALQNTKAVLFIYNRQFKIFKFSLC